MNPAARRRTAVCRTAFLATGAAICLAGCGQKPAEPAVIEVSALNPAETTGRLPTEPEVRLADAELEFKFFADPRPDEDALPAEEAARLTAEHGDDIREAVLREQLSGREKVEGTVFVSFGIDDEGNPIEPSPEFFERLKDLPYKIRPESKARYPEPGEMTGPDTLRCVEDPETGEPSWVYGCQIRRWFEGLEVEVDVEQYISPLGAGGGIQVLKRNQGKWVPIEYGGIWIS